MAAVLPAGRHRTGHGRAEDVIARQARESEQVEEAVGRGDPRSRRLLRGLPRRLVHHVNVVHGLLERMGEPLPGRVVDGAWWAGGRSSPARSRSRAARAGTAPGSSCSIPASTSRASSCTSNDIRQLMFPSPWLKLTPTRYQRQDPDDYANAVRRYRSFEESFRRELVHFHACCVEGVACLTPPEQARIDTELLTAMFLASSGREPAVPFPNPSLPLRPTSR